MEEKRIGNLIKYHRKEKGYTIVQLSEISGVSNPYISQIENGKFKPSPEILEKLSKALGIDYVLLMVEAGYLDTDKLTDSEKLKRQIESMKEMELVLSNELATLEREKEKYDDEEKVNQLTKKITNLQNRLIGLKDDIDYLLTIQQQAVDQPGVTEEQSIDLTNILRSDLPIKVNGKTLSPNEKSKLLAMAEIMFSDET